ncbi:hypothetical protein Tco_0365300 [Tanacetum coccineum]
MPRSTTHVVAAGPIRWWHVALACVSPRYCSSQYEIDSDTWLVKFKKFEQTDYDWFSCGLILVWIFSKYDEIYDSAVLILTALDGSGAARKPEGTYLNSGHEDVNANGFTSWVESEPSSRKTEADTKKAAQMQKATKSRADMEKKSDMASRLGSAIMTLIDSGSTVKATILDVVKKERLVDLSLKPMVNIYTENNDSRSPKKVRKRSVQKDLEVHQTVNAVVEIVFGAESSSFHDAKPLFFSRGLCSQNKQNPYFPRFIRVIWPKFQENVPSLFMKDKSLIAEKVVMESEDGSSTEAMQTPTSSATMTPIDNGSTLKATNIDVVKKGRLVDLSLKPGLVNIYMEDIDSLTPKKARKPSTAKDTSASSDAKSVSTLV